MGDGMCVRWGALSFFLLNHRKRATADVTMRQHVHACILKSHSHTLQPLLFCLGFLLFDREGLGNDSTRGMGLARDDSSGAVTL